MLCLRDSIRHDDPCLQQRLATVWHAQTLTEVYAYLDAHRDHIDYAAYKELGLPLGSGLVESACKWLIQL